MTTLTFAQGTQILEGLSGLDIASQIATFKGTNDLAKVETVLMDAAEFATLAGYIFPGAATAAQWIKVAEVALPILVKINAALPPAPVLHPGEFEAFGQVFDGTLLQGRFAN